MKEEHVSAITAFTFKDKGFTESSSSYYTIPKNTDDVALLNSGFVGGGNWNTGAKNTCSAPTLAQAVNWLSWQRKCYVEVFLFDIKDPEKGWTYRITRVLGSVVYTTFHDKKYTNYFKALSNAVDECVSLI